MHSTRGYDSPLTPQIFHILLALCDAPAHGYDIQQQVSTDSAGSVILSSSTLYGALGTLTKRKLIEGYNGRPQVAPGKPRRYYQITSLGRSRLDQERLRLERAAILSRQRLLGPTHWRVK